MKREWKTSRAQFLGAGSLDTTKILLDKARRLFISRLIRYLLLNRTEFNMQTVYFC